MNLQLELTTRYLSLHSDAKRESPIATAEPRDPKGKRPMVTELQLLQVWVVELQRKCYINLKPQNGAITQESIRFLCSKI